MRERALANDFVTFTPSPTFERGCRLPWDWIAGTSTVPTCRRSPWKKSNC